MRTSRDEWRRLVAGWRASGLSCRRYADQAGVNPATLAWWKWKLGADGERFGAAALLPFVEVAPLAATAMSAPGGERAGIELAMGDVMVSVAVGFDEGTLLRVLDALESRR